MGGSRTNGVGRGALGGEPLTQGAALVLLVVILAGLWVVRPGQGQVTLQPVTFDFETRRAVVRSVDQGRCPDVMPPPLPGELEEPPEDRLCLMATVEFLDGQAAGTQSQVPLDEHRPLVGQGDEVFLQRLVGSADDVPFQVAERVRTPQLLLLALAFGLVVVGLGRLKGVRALVSLLATMGLLIWYALPAILQGRSPVAVAVVTAGAISYLVLYLTYGINRRSTVALLGTLAGLGVTVVLAAVWVPLARLTGLEAIEAANVIGGTGLGINPAGLLLAGIVIGALGAINDVTVTQAAAVWELRAAAPSMPARELFAAGLRIGRDHMGSIVNTLVLAYVGASLPVLIAFALLDQSVPFLLNGEAIASEIVRTLTGSIGLVLSVPITTGLAAWVAGRIRASEAAEDLPHAPEATVEA